MSPGRFRLRIIQGLAIFAVLLALSPVQPGGDPASSNRHALGSGETIVVPVDLPAAGSYWISVEQQDVDVVVTATPQDDGLSITVNNPLPGHRYDTLLVKTTSATQYVLKLFARTGTAKGLVTLRTESIGDGSGARTAALEAVTNATRIALQHENNIPARHEAIPLFESAIAHWEEVGDTRQQGRTLASLAALLLRQEKTRESLTLYQSAIALLDDRSDRYTLGAVHTDLGYAHMELDDYAAARAAFEQALALVTGFKDRRLEAQSLNNIGLTLLYPGQLQEALAWIERADAIFRTLGDLAGEAMTVSNLGFIHDKLGDPDLAIRSLNRSLGINKELGDRQNHATVLSILANLLLELGEFDDALLNFQQATRTWEEIGQKREQARSLHSTGITYLSMGDLERARTFFEDALERRRAADDRLGEAYTLLALGRLYQQQSRPENAKESLSLAETAFEKLDSPAGLTASLIASARLETSAGDPQRALRILERAEAVQRETSDTKIATQLAYQRGMARLAAGQTKAALKDLRHSLALARNTRSEMGEAQALVGLALAHRAMDDVDAAMDAADETIAIIEVLRSGLSNPELRGSFLETMRDAYELRIDLWMRRHREDPDSGFDRRAFLAAEGARARMLLDFIQTARIDVYSGAEPEQHAELKRLRRRLGIRVTRQAESNGDDKEQTRLDREIQQIRTSLDELETRIRKEHPRVGTLDSADLPSMDDIHGLLDQDSALLEYALGEERSFLWVVTDDSLASFVLPGRSELEALARSFYTQLRTLDPGSEQAGRQRQTGMKLATALLAPAYELLAGKSLAIVPDGALHYVPFAALPVPATTNGARGDPLLVNHELTTLPSASSLVALRRLESTRPALGGAVAVLADPVFDAADPRIRGVSRQARNGSDSSATRGGFERIPWTRDEALAIGELVAPKALSMALDFDAKRDFLLDERISDFYIIHLATHGYLNSRQPRLSGIVLSRFDSNGSRIDGNLLLQDIFGLKLSANLVVLSACETALGEEIRGEGLVGLTRGFMYAGVPRVIASLWLVRDRSTSQLMSRLYAGMLNESLSPAASLRQAQLAIRQKHGKRDPYYWSTFSLHGDWRASAAMPASPVSSSREKLAE